MHLKEILRILLYCKGISRVFVLILMNYNTLFSDRFLPDKAIDLVDEAGSRVRLRHAQVGLLLTYSRVRVLSSDGIPLSLDTVFLQHLQLPEEARELDKELRQITKDKNEAVRSQDFEKVVLLLCFLH